MFKQRKTVFIVTALVTGSLAPSALRSQTSRQRITETTITFGRSGPDAPNTSFVANTLLIGDLGLRWTYPSTRSFGLSLAGGYDVPNEGVLGGVRGRIAQEWKRRRLEGSLGLLFSSAGVGGLGAVIGVALYPVPAMAFVAQADKLPTTSSASAGLRLAAGPGVFSWAVAGLWGLLAGAFQGL